MKICTKCKIEKNEINFHRYRHRTSGRFLYKSWCKDCRKLEKNLYIPRSVEQVVKVRKAYRERFPNKRMVESAKKRSIIAGLPFSIKDSDIVVPDFCPILGIPLFRSHGKGKHSPNSPSLDKIIPELGYTVNNIQVISNKANVIKQDATLEELVMIGEWAKEMLLEGYTCAQ